MMKSILSLALYTATALAQGIYINSPAAGAELQAGETVTVQLVRPVRPSHSPPLYSFTSTSQLHQIHSHTNPFLEIGLQRKCRRNRHRHRHRILLWFLRVPQPGLGDRKPPLQRSL